MTTVVLQLPPRPRLRPQGPDAPAPQQGTTDYAYVTSPDGLEVETAGRCGAALLPTAPMIVAAVAETDLSWHRITLPKVPAARMRAALVGLLEEALLEDVESVHLALAPGAVPGQPTWVAAVDRKWLRTELASLQRARVFVDRVVPMAWPDDPPIGHFSNAEGAEPGALDAASLTWAHSDGVATVPLQGSLARALVPSPAPATTRWTTSPAAAAAAEQWLGAPVNVMPLEERLLLASRSLWNLRQFDLASRTRGARAVRESMRRLLSPAWRPVRIGAAALVVAQIAGLNLWAWHQRSEIDARRNTLQNLVKASFPRVNELDIQRDPAAVMQREVQALRSLAGKAGDADLEPMLLAAAAAWPLERPVENFRFEPGRLSLPASGWTDAQVERFRTALRPAGWQLDAREGRLTMTRARPGVTS